MATLANTLRSASRNCRRCQVTARWPRFTTIERQRAFTSTSMRWDSGVDKDSTKTAEDELVTEEAIADLQKRVKEALELNKSLDLENLDYESAKKLLNLQPEKAEEEISEVANFMRQSLGEIMQRREFRVAELDEMERFEEPRTPPVKEGFWNSGENKREMAEIGEDPEFEGDDITAIAHTELEQHREYREYARVAAWEMPLLSKMAKTFEPPKANQILRFRYTTYMGEHHPAEKKVVVEFCVDDIPDLTQIHKDKLKKLVGPRYNPETQIIKMSCEMFAVQAQNKRYLSDLVDNLIKEAMDPTDTFEDVPLDLRHHTFKVKPKFPREWRMTEERRVQLQAARQRNLLLAGQQGPQEAILDGVEEIKTSLAQQRQKAVPVPLAVGGGTSKSQGKRAQRLPLRR